MTPPNARSAVEPGEVAALIERLRKCDADFRKNAGLTFVIQDHDDPDDPTLFGQAADMLASLTAERDRYSAAIIWALGEEDSDFRPRYKTEGPYYWRTELRKRAAPAAPANEGEG